jgi:hypothetical protein
MLQALIQLNNKGNNMAHFAKLENRVVVQVIVVSDKDTADEHGVEKEDIGIAFCSNLLGGTWKQTSYNGNIRKNYAGVGYTYDETLDAFVPPKPYASWVLDTDKAQWKAPVDYPTDEGKFTWNEATTSWVEVAE